MGGLSRRALVGAAGIGAAGAALGPLFGLCRLPVGHLTLRTAGTVGREG